MYQLALTCLGRQLKVCQYTQKHSHVEFYCFDIQQPSYRMSLSVHQLVNGLENLTHIYIYVLYICIHVYVCICAKLYMCVQCYVCVIYIIVIKSEIMYFAENLCN